MIFIFESFALVFVILPATVFYIFEGHRGRDTGIIFAALSAIYIARRSIRSTKGKRKESPISSPRRPAT